MHARQNARAESALEAFRRQKRRLPSRESTCTRGRGDTTTAVMPCLCATGQTCACIMYGYSCTRLSTLRIFAHLGLPEQAGVPHMYATAASKPHLGKQVLARDTDTSSRASSGRRKASEEVARECGIPSSARTFRVRNNCCGSNTTQSKHAIRDHAA